MKNILKAGLLSTLLLGGTACEDFLDKQPLDQVVESNFYQTEAEAQAALFAAYDVLGWSQLGDQYGLFPFTLLSDIASDDAYKGGATREDGDDMIDIDTHDINPDLIFLRGLWITQYQGIYRANLFLDKIEGITASDDFKKQGVAEAKFLRAFYYFRLVRAFGNIPLITNTLSADEYNQPQSTPEQVFNQIAKDLNEAIPNLPVTNDGRGRATTWAAKALLAKAFMFKSDVYGGNLKAGEETIDATVAINHLEDVIDESGHDLLDNYADVFSLANEFSIESVFEISFSSEKLGDWGCTQCGDGNIMSLMVGPRFKVADDTYRKGWSFNIPTQELADAFEAGDPRRGATILSQDELEGGVEAKFQHTGFYSRKYATTVDYPKGAGDEQIHRGNNIREIRFSDVLLMAAELQVRYGDAGKAQDHLDRVRSRAGLALVPATEENIFNERRVELALEGHRYWDLLRKGAAYAQSELASTGTPTADFVGEPVDFEITASRLTQTKGLFPIPQIELTLMNGEWKQNDGY